jgi:hypothetical protein
LDTTFASFDWLPIDFIWIPQKLSEYFVNLVEYWLIWKPTFPLVCCLALLFCAILWLLKRNSGLTPWPPNYVYLRFHVFLLGPNNVNLHCLFLISRSMLSLGWQCCECFQQCPAALEWLYSVNTASGTPQLLFIAHVHCNGKISVSVKLAVANFMPFQAHIDQKLHFLLS